MGELIDIRDYLERKGKLIAEEASFQENYLRSLELGQTDQTTKRERGTRRLLAALGFDS